LVVGDEIPEYLSDLWCRARWWLDWSWSLEKG
jgi:hypothetical protein